MATARPTANGINRPAAPRKNAPPARMGTFAPRTNDKRNAKTRGRASGKARGRGGRAAVVPSIGSRVTILSLLVGVLYGGLALRLFHLQVNRHAEFVRMADELRERAVRLPARRGVLVDRAGAVLVRNEPACDIVVDPNEWFVRNSPKAGDTPEFRRQSAEQGLSQILLDTNVHAIIEQRGLTRGRSGRYRTIDIARRVAVGVGERVNKASLPGVAALPTARRTALDGDFAPHVIGFTGREGKGLDGLEHGLDESLTGEAGLLAAEFDKHGAIPGTIEAERPARHGRDIALTLDSELQHVTQEALWKGFTKARAQAATALVIDPKTGDILALANYPTYNVNHRNGTALASRLNRAVSAPYEPGSTMKAVTIAAALEENKINPNSRFYCAGFKQIGKRAIHCHAGEKHGDEDLTNVVRTSCNVATAECAFRLGREKFYAHLQDFGFGQKVHSGLPGEDLGLLAPSERWSDIQLANVAFGQGVSVTPLQMVGAYGAIANDGVLVRPRIVYGERGADGNVVSDKADEGRRVLSVRTARELRRMLATVMEEKGGTGNAARLNGWTAGGKTGTAQIAEHGHYGNKYVASFIGMAPLSAPRFVVLVAITAPQGDYYGGTVAGPVFKEIAEAALMSRRVPHDKAPVVKKVKTAR